MCWAPDSLPRIHAGMPLPAIDPSNRPTSMDQSCPRLWLRPRAATCSGERLASYAATHSSWSSSGSSRTRRS